MQTLLVLSVQTHADIIGTVSTDTCRHWYDERKWRPGPLLSGLCCANTLWFKHTHIDTDTHTYTLWYCRESVVAQRSDRSGPTDTHTLVQTHRLLMPIGNAAKSHEPKAMTPKPEAKSQQPAVKSQKPEAKSQKPEAQRCVTVDAGGHWPTSKKNCGHCKDSLVCHARRLVLRVRRLVFRRLVGRLVRLGRALRALLPRRAGPLRARA